MQRKCILTRYENWKWPYEDALAWMDYARSLCLNTGQESIAIGSHTKDIVTLGRHASEREIIDAEFLRQHDVNVIQVDRGGGATLHGPGQVVLYPVISLNKKTLTIPSFTASLEDAMINCLQSFAITAHKICGQPGVFVDGAKIGSVGLRISQGVATHGISLNVTNNLSLYSKIATCGKVNAAITSMATLLGENLDVSIVGRRLNEHLKI